MRVSEDEMDLMLRDTLRFLSAIGIRTVVKPGVSGFLPRCRISRGSLYLDETCPISNILHEAGHLAIIPPAYRRSINKDVEAGIAKMWETMGEHTLHPDHPLMRAAMSCGDSEATAWAFAAGLAIGLPPEMIILDSEYQGDGAEIRGLLAYSARNPGAAGGYIGIHGLAWGGMCSASHWGPHPCWPKFRTWTQDAVLETGRSRVSTLLSAQSWYQSTPHTTDRFPLCTT
jgi:hypothetical protein